MPDLNMLDEDSVIILLELTLCLDEQETTIEKFFEEICFD